MSALSYDDIVLAQGRIADTVRATPVLRNQLLDDLAGAELWLKAENLQHVGAFKARGAFNTVAQLSPEQLQRGLVTYSSGNHAQAVAWVAQQFAVKARIFMPTNAPAVKVAAVKHLGAEIVSVGTTSLQRQAAALEYAKESGAIIIEPFDHPHTIAGQGTASLELKEQVFARTKGKSLDQLFVPVGGGGLIAGACLAFAGSDTEVIAVEPTTCDSMNQSISAGHVVAVEPGPTIADGLKPTKVGQLNFEICKEHLTSCVTVEDEELSRALVQLLLWGKTLVEPSGAAALAAALKGARVGGRVGVILSGGNLAPEQVLSLVERYSASASL